VSVVVGEGSPKGLADKAEQRVEKSSVKLDTGDPGSQDITRITCGNHTTSDIEERLKE
jgi:hypothetical protein